MNTQIELSKSLYDRIARHAVPFIDKSPLDVIERWADYFDQNTSLLGTPTAASTSKLNPLNPPDLLFTICRGSFGMDEFRKWNEMVRIAHIHAFKKLGSFEAVRAATSARIANGDKKGVDGFRFIAEVGFSVQGTDANHAWQYALKLAQFTKTPLKVTLEWRHHVKAVLPGETHDIIWNP